MRAKWNAELDAQHEANSTATKDKNEYKSREGQFNAQEKQEAEVKSSADAVTADTKSNGLDTVVGVGGKVTKTKAEKATAIVNNLHQQQQSVKTTRINSGRAQLSQFSPLDTDNSHSFVDASTAANNINNDESSNYFNVIVPALLSAYNCADSNGTVCQCDSLACFIPRCHANHLHNGHKQIVFDSCATSHIFTNIKFK